MITLVLDIVLLASIGLNLYFNVRTWQTLRRAQAHEREMDSILRFGKCIATDAWHRYSQILEEELKNVQETKIH